MTGLFSVAALVMTLGPATAANADAQPLLTTNEATARPCAPLTFTGTGFLPSTKMTIVESGRTVAEKPLTDTSGAFSYATTVPCNQASGFTVVQVTDGVHSTSAVVTVAAATPVVSTAAQGTPPPASASKIDRFAPLAARIALVVVAVVEVLVLLGRKRQRARRRVAVQ